MDLLSVDSGGGGHSNNQSIRATFFFFLPNSPSDVINVFQVEPSRHFRFLFLLRSNSSHPSLCFVPLLEDHLRCLLSAARSSLSFLSPSFISSSAFFLSLFFPFVSVSVFCHFPSASLPHCCFPFVFPHLFEPGKSDETFGLSDMSLNSG